MGYPSLHPWEESPPSLGTRKEVLGMLFCFLLGHSRLSNNNRHTLIPPRGYSIAGVNGSSGQWVDGFGILIRAG